MKTAATNRVLVVIPTYNRADTLPRAIRSALDQSYKDLTVLVVDDASTDDTPEVLAREFPCEPRLALIRVPYRGGAPRARNLGVEHANGRYVAFLDSDDEWHSRKIELQVEALSSRSDAVAAFSWIEHRDQNGSLFQLKIPATIETKDLLAANLLGTTSSCLVDVQVFRKLGGFDPNLPSCQDWEMWLRLATEGKLVVCQEPLTFYYSHGTDRISRNAKAVIKGHEEVMSRIMNYFARPAERGALRLEHHKVWVWAFSSLGMHRRALWNALYLAVFSTSRKERREAVHLASQAFRSMARKAYPWRTVFDAFSPIRRGNKVER